jgi:hypothetical protein
MEISSGTETWFAECERLFNRCVAESGKNRPAEVRESFEILLDLLRDIDKGSDEIVFFADEGGSWQVGVNWEDVLPAYFTCLSTTADPDEYAEAVTAVVDDFVLHDREKYLREARNIGTTLQRKLLL